MSKHEDLEELNIKQLFQTEEKYTIPIYQRNYAWDEKQIVQLIDDINDYIGVPKEQKYYIGSLVVYRRDDRKMEVIDGQQRLTTLFILMSVLKNSFEQDISLDSNFLNFESRKKSSKTLKLVLTNNSILKNESLNTKIIEAKKIIEKKLKNKEIKIDKFYNYLIDKVIILRVNVPNDTDLNHYFEIMNNRGEQLEKHEILKSRMLEKLKENTDATSLFNKIWEACANMDKYVQYGFNSTERTHIFGKNWNDFSKQNFNELWIKQKKEQSGKNLNEKKVPTLLNIISPVWKLNEIDEKTIDKDTPERFNSVINFSNFLLHVLKIQENGGKDKNSISLDDKRLLETFSIYYQDEEAVKIFAFNMLKIKFLFDNYIIKREYNNSSDEWSLKQLIKNDESSENNTAYYKNRFGNKDGNKHILIILSMFHVSAPTLIYKHWLNASLKYLFEHNKEIDSNEYIQYLENLSKAYMTDRFLVNEPIDYHTIIFNNDSKSKNTSFNCNILNQGTEVENYIFNYLDYLLWQKNKDLYKEFVFAFRTSVEHYYPQHPMENIPSLKKKRLNNFGNLCLISNSENSRLSNFTPKAKRDFYKKQKDNSIKQQIMMNESKYNNWSIEEIKNHNKEMLQVLKESFNDSI